MEVDLLKRLVFSTSSIVYSKSVELIDANAVLAEIVVQRAPSGFAARCQAQQGNDDENWLDVGSSLGITTLGPTNLTVGFVGARRLRLLFESTGTAGQIVLGVALAAKKL